jgi:hemoglobin-like flavoprotein
MALDVRIIRESFEQVKPIADEVVSFFYQTLFTQYPEAKKIFEKVDMDKQKKQLIQSLVKIVNGLDDLDSLSQYLRSMGSRHVTYGVEENHYAMVGKSLVTTFRYFFGQDWTLELEDQWILAIGFIADEMLEGAKQVPIIATSNQKTIINPKIHLASTLNNHHTDPNHHDLIQAARQVARSALVKAIEDEIDGELKKIAREKASQILAEAIRDEAEQFQKNFSSSKKKVA